MEPWVTVLSERLEKQTIKPTVLGLKSLLTTAAPNFIIEKLPIQHDFETIPITQAQYISHPKHLLLPIQHDFETIPITTSSYLFNMTLRPFLSHKLNTLAILDTSSYLFNMTLRPSHKLNTLAILNT